MGDTRRIAITVQELATRRDWTNGLDIRRPGRNDNTAVLLDMATLQHEMRMRVEIVERSERRGETTDAVTAVHAATATVHDRRSGTSHIGLSSNLPHAATSVRHRAQAGR